MMKKNDQKARDIFHLRIKKGLLGPGSDNWGIPDEDEIISDYPLLRYFTGILFPEKDMQQCSTQDKADEDELKAEIRDEDLDIQYKIEPKSETGNYPEEEHHESRELTPDSDTDNEDTKIIQNHFFPNNIGLTICVDRSIDELDVEFNFGIYYQPPQNEIKIQVEETVYKSLAEETPDFPYRNILKYENGFLSLSRALKGSRRQRTDEYSKFDEFKNKHKYSALKNSLDYFEKLTGRVWKRKPIVLKERLILGTGDTAPFKILDLQKFGVDEDLHAGYYKKVYFYNENNYVKILLVNQSKKHLPNQFNNKNDKLNRKCLFQSRIAVHGDKSKFRPYKSHRQSNPFDEEEEVLNFQYRKLSSYGIGHNCAVAWNEELSKVETSFIPQYGVNDIKNDLEEDFMNEDTMRILEKALKIKNLSIFGMEKNEIVENLSRFIDLYGSWINQQKQENLRNSGKDREIGEKIIEKLVYNYDRLKINIHLLDDDRIFRTFRYANTAMLLQLIISNDEDFCKKEKHLTEIKVNSIYNDFDFFRNYDFARLGFEPKYRPFQLAFFILNLEGIVRPEAESRKKIVDLIWFPTGGGKTEAYLAVAAFTIIWRRLNNQTGFEGTSVIMRYTLRLLTTQQFERASRLIASLEFLRRQFVEDLRDEPVTIGLWVGMSTCPNKIDDAKSKVEEIEKECNENGSPEEKNIFQVSACPWCGTKITSKIPHPKYEWSHGFDADSKVFRIRCLNQCCPFSKKLPVQVVDEMLYKEPPTLLFATVDKFAALAFQEKGHVFFNSLNNEGMPPDLIIQDELHLLSGPLGSIVGIFESVIELLSTKNGTAPKIIAATATTRNTNRQVCQLYGGKEVNIFPPAGLNYDDSFFAREDKNKGRRKYIGLVPTGKTTTDTQLQILAHLITARLEVYNNFQEQTDNYWTIVSYYNSLKDVGKISNKIGDEVSTFTELLQIRLLGENPELTFNFFNIISRTRELTSREESHKIKSILNDLGNQFKKSAIEKSERGNTYIRNIVDLVLATNMISVGIDIARLNVMLINGMPRNVAEYIQASSRVGRQTDGLVLALLDPNKARDKSFFEHFLPFHQALYKSIEPLSVTPFTENTIDKMVKNIMITFVRHKVPGMAADGSAGKFDSSMLEELKEFIKKRFHNFPVEYSFFRRKLDNLANEWLRCISPEVKLGKYRELLKRPNQKNIHEDMNWVLMESMREIDSSTYIQIRENF
jgi:hypothetical protein